MGRVWQSNSNLRSHQILENVFLTYGPSKCPKNIPNPLCIHVLLFLTCFRAPGHFSHPSFIHIGISHATKASHVFLLQVFSHFPHFPWPKHLFLCCGLNGPHRFRILGCIAFFFAHAMPIIIVEFRLLTQWSISPFTNPFFGCKLFSVIPSMSSLLLCVHPVFWFEIV